MLPNKVYMCAQMKCTSNKYLGEMYEINHEKLMIWSLKLLTAITVCTTCDSKDMVKTIDVNILLYQFVLQNRRRYLPLMYFKSVHNY